MLQQDGINISIEGHVKIFAYEDANNLHTDSGEVILDKRNAVHKEHASIMVARALADRDNGAIHSMYFGTGGATVDPLGQIIYASPNVTGNADLNTPVYFEVVNDRLGAPHGNQMAVKHINGTLFSDVEIRCIMDKNEPLGAPAFDNSSININDNNFMFDEIGLKNSQGLLLTHIVFSPIEKSANRIFEVVYTLRVSIA